MLTRVAFGLQCRFKNVLISAKRQKAAVFSPTAAEKANAKVFVIGSTHKNLVSAVIVCSMTISTSTR